MKKTYTYTLFIALALLVAAAIAGIGLNSPISGPLLIVGLLLLAFALRGSEKAKGYSYSVVIFSSVAAAMYYPAPFQQIGDFKLGTLIVPLLQIIMFGMGTSMSIKDFEGVVKMPKGVGVGLLCQFTIMPLLGFGIAKLFNFPSEIAAGIILIGSAPSGLASNVMAYLAKANVALSVTMTAVATMLAPLMTPLWMKLLAGQYVPIEFWGMMWSIVKIVIIPIIGGLIFNKLFHGKAPWVDRAMPLLSMAGIAIIISIITASGRDALLTYGVILVFAALLHNTAGYFLGYKLCKAIKLPERDCRTIAFEVGMQNGGLASGIAQGMGKVATMGLGPSVFGSLMNITGSILANWWRDKPTGEEDPK
ncbi:MAG: bile acid:sodium symporter family protein [Imperialibacter sp.]|uniref:bile acid:sodium symporter family protein n=1 Tax=Imperialibacter sp. TaxID=2038411 RepID=UPI003A89E8DB